MATNPYEVRRHYTVRTSTLAALLLELESRDERVISVERAAVLVAETRWHVETQAAK